MSTTSAVIKRLRAELVRLAEENVRLRAALARRAPRVLDADPVVCLDAEASREGLG